MREEKKKQIIKISVFITSIFVIFLSITYAFMNQTAFGTKKQVITTGNLQIELEEENEIVLENALPMYDEVGKLQKSFNFRLVNNSSYDINYILYLEDITEAGKEKLSYDTVKYNLTKENQEYEPVLLSSISENRIDQGISKANTTSHYSLRLWIKAEQTNEEAIKDKTLKFRIGLKATNDLENTLKLSYEQDNYDFIEIGPNASLATTVSIKNPHISEAKYELYYEIIEPTTITNTIESGYLKETKNLPNGIIAGKEIKEVSMVINNTGNQTIKVKIGIKETLPNYEINLSNKEKPLTREVLQKYFLYDYTGNYQTLTVPISGKYKVELWGAGPNPALGGYTRGTISLEQNEELSIVVGGNSSSPLIGGYNGGGTSGIFREKYGHSGGGATDVRLKNPDNTWNNIISLRSRIMVAAGGCGGNGNTGSSKGTTGDAGGLIGYTTTPSGYAAQFANGGSQTSGGTSGKGVGSSTTSESGSPGGFGYAGNGGKGYSDGQASGGGSGYYGGSGGVGAYNDGWGGGGGSSFISGHAGCIAIKSETDQTPKVTTYSKIEDSYHYSGKVFTDTVMIDGAGYNWTTKKEAKTNMPTHDSLSTMTGNNGNGYARITYLGD